MHEKRSKQFNDRGYPNLAIVENNTTPYLNGEKLINHDQSLAGNIEQFIGYAQVPVGIAGPIQINGSKGDTACTVPMATTEGALVASYNRGMKAFKMCGGLTVRCVDSGVQRCPSFKFESMVDGQYFVDWVKSQESTFLQIVKASSRYAHLKDIQYLQEGNTVIITFTYDTGAAAGQNMVTIVTDAICRQLINDCPIKIKQWYIEGNYSGDKKATSKSLQKVRGKRVIAEGLLSKQIISSVLKSTPENIFSFYQSANLAMIQSGAIGNLGHVANALTAIYLACGQDVACVSESAAGILRMELTETGDLYTSLTLPSLIVGVIGGGTGLATQAECLQLLGCNHPETAEHFAEICCATALCGELSIAAAIAEGHFTSAHQSLGRKK